MNNMMLWLLLFFVGSSYAVGGEVPEWQMIEKKSTLKFVFTQAGEAQTGQFHEFSGQYWFDPDNLAACRFEVSVKLTSLDTGDKDRDGILRSADMFSIDQWPEALFKTLSIQHVKGDRYQAEAELTIRDQTRKLPFPFRMKFSQKKGKPVFDLHAELVLQRLDYHVGQGDLQETTWVGDEVQVIVDVRAASRKR